MEINFMLKALVWIVLLCMIGMASSNSSGKMCVFLGIQIVAVSAFISLIDKEAVFPFVIILTILGGLLILFLYFTASSAPEHMKQNTVISFFKWIMMSCAIIFVKPNIKSIKESIKFSTTNQELAIFSFTSMTVCTLMFILLIMTLLIIMWKCTTIKGPLRQNKSPWNSSSKNL